MSDVVERMALERASDSGRWVAVSFDSRPFPKDHLGPRNCGPNDRTLCGKSLYPHGFPTGELFAIDEPYACRRCVTAWRKGDWRTL